MRKMMNQKAVVDGFKKGSSECARKLAQRRWDLVAKSISNTGKLAADTAKTNNPIGWMLAGSILILGVTWAICQCPKDEDPQE